MNPTVVLRCPKCAGEMATYERSGITLDQCRECRGIFLDRGELEKMVDAEGGAWMGPQRAISTNAAPAPNPSTGYPPTLQGRGDLQPPARYDDRDRDAYRTDWDDDEREFRDNRSGPDPRGSYGRPPKKRSFFGELLEGFGD